MDSNNDLNQSRDDERSNRTDKDYRKQNTDDKYRMRGDNELKSNYSEVDSSKDHGKRQERQYKKHDSDFFKDQ